MRKQLFRHKANRLCVFIPGYGLVPVAGDKDDAPIFVTGKPQRIGDDAIVEVEGKTRLVRLLRSELMHKSGTYLVDLGPARRRLNAELKGGTT